MLGISLLVTSFPMKRAFFVVLLLAILVAPQLSLAQSNAAGIGISPAIIEEPGSPGQVLEQVVNVRNLSGVNQTYYLFTRDIVGVQGNGTPIFADEGTEKTGYEMSEWISLGTTEINLEPNQEAPIAVTITVPEFATPGSHFAGIFVSMDPPEMRSVGASVAYQVANIVTIRVAGDAVEKAEIREFSTGNYIYGEPKVDFTARIENQGSTLVRPVGPLEVYNMFGTRVANVLFNDSQGAVFPGATRTFTIDWEGEGPGFGRYEAVLSLIYGEQGRQSTISSTVTFWILPANIILPALGVLAVLLLGSYVGARLYVRRKLQYAEMGGSRRIMRRRRSGGMSAALLVLVVMLAVTAIFLLILLALFA